MLFGVPYRWMELALAALAGVEPYEVVQALSGGRLRLPMRPNTGDPRLLGIVAPTNSGRLLTVTVRHDEGFNWWIVGARDANDAERAAHKQHERRED
jgi:hypothetical protein